MNQIEIDYLLKRAREEAERSHEAQSPLIARVHRDFAVAYTRRLAELGGGAQIEIVRQAA